MNSVSDQKDIIQSKYKVGDYVRWKYKNDWGRGEIHQVHHGLDGLPVYHCVTFRGFWWAVPESYVVDLVEE